MWPANWLFGGIWISVAAINEHSGMTTECKFQYLRFLCLLSLLTACLWCSTLLSKIVFARYHSGQTTTPPHAQPFLHAAPDLSLHHCVCWNVDKLVSSASCIRHEPHEEYLYRKPKALHTVNAVFSDHSTYFMFVRKFLYDALHL